MVVVMYVHTLVALYGTPVAAHGRGARQVKVPPLGNGRAFFPNYTECTHVLNSYGMASISPNCAGPRRPACGGRCESSEHGERLGMFVVWAVFVVLAQGCACVQSMEVSFTVHRSHLGSRYKLG